MAKLAKENPALLGLEIFQKAIAESKNLQRIDLKQNSVIRISDPIPLQKIAPKKLSYFEKNKVQPILTIKEEYFDKTPW